MLSPLWSLFNTSSVEKPLPWWWVTGACTGAINSVTVTCSDSCAEEHPVVLFFFSILLIGRSNECWSTMLTDLKGVSTSTVGNWVAVKLVHVHPFPQWLRFLSEPGAHSFTNLTKRTYMHIPVFQHTHTLSHKSTPNIPNKSLNCQEENEQAYHTFRKRSVVALHI